MRRILAASALCLLAAPSWAGTKSVTLSLPTMDCPVCPITVRKALAKVAGVSKAEVDFEKRRAIVTFDDSRTDVEALTRATKDAGYPSTPVASGK